jgi:diguanylate cyclase (GGDEF)-like protein
MALVRDAMVARPLLSSGAAFAFGLLAGLAGSGYLPAGARLWAQVGALVAGLALAGPMIAWAVVPARHRKAPPPRPAMEVARAAEADVITLTDPLTGVANRRAANAWVGAQSTGEHGGLGLVVLRVQAVERVRDAVGGRAADQLLRRCADELRQIARPQDLLMRAREGEFAIFAPRVGEKDVTELAGRCRAALAATAGPGRVGHVFRVATRADWIPDGVPPDAEWLEAALADVSRDGPRELNERAAATA